MTSRNRSSTPRMRSFWFMEPFVLNLVAEGQPGQLSEDIGSAIRAELSVGPQFEFTIARTFLNYFVTDATTDVGFSFLGVGMIAAYQSIDPIDLPVVSTHDGRYFVHDSMPVQELGVIAGYTRPFDVNGLQRIDSRAQQRIQKEQTLFVVAGTHVDGATIEISVQGTISMLVKY